MTLLNQEKEELMKAKRRPWIVSAVLILISLIASGQSVPQLINYQGRLANASGQPVTGTINLTFTFYSAATSGTVYLTVLQSNVQVTNGVYNLLIGSGTITPGTETTLAAVFKKHQDVWLGIKVNSDPEMLPRSRIGSVPFAIAVDTQFLTQWNNNMDSDGDGHYPPTSTNLPNDDCNDHNPYIYPGAPEICDGVDNQCPGDPGYGQVDEGCSAPQGCSDRDGDGRGPGCPAGLDACPDDPDNWARSHCANCRDADGDGWFVNCDAYNTMNGPDCDDSDANVWNTCATCQDADGDGYYELCNAYNGILGPDCNDADIDNWTSCATCIDLDGDNWYIGCDSYIIHNGPDCNDTDVNNWVSCSACLDNDADAWLYGCDDYITLPGPDCDDWSPDIYPGAPENCDGYDNQCPGDPGYGIIDEGCPPPGSWQKIGSDVRITNDPRNSLGSSLVWAGTEYGVSWKDSRDGNYEIYFARIAADGTKSGTDVRITEDPHESWEPSLVWIGTEYGVSWYDDRDGPTEIYFARIAASGTKIGGDVRITNDVSSSGYPSLAWTGSEYGVSWMDCRDGNDEIYFARIAANGAKIGADVRITYDGYDIEGTSLVWTYMEYGVSWMGYRDGNWEIYFARIAANGVKIGADVRITNDPDSSENPSLVWTGTQYGVSWMGYRDGNWEIYFTRLSANGVKIGADVRITNDPDSSENPSLVRAGTEYGMSCVDNREGNFEIYFTRLSANGKKIGSDVRITNDPHYKDSPSLVWTGTEYGVSWYDDRDGNYEIYFARIGFVP